MSHNTKKGSREQLRELLLHHSEEAVRTLIDTMENEQATASLRVDCAKEILNRTYGKSPIGEEMDNSAVTVTLSEELQEFSR